jgi:hypothetical protein
MFAEIRSLFGDLAVDDVHLRIRINMVGDEAVETIQRGFDVRKLPRELEAIMNCWIRNHSWYNEDYVAKFECCLEAAVANELINFMITFLKGRREELEDGVLNVDHFYDAVERASHWLLRIDWETYPSLTNMAILWAQHYGDHVLQCDYDHNFSWFCNETRTTQCTLLHVPMYIKNVDVELLPDDFQHKTGWDCSICLEDDVDVPSCVKTTCAHIFHRSCLDKCKRVYFEQEENYHKTCIPCPLCRADVN